VSGVIATERLALIPLPPELLALIAKQHWVSRLDAIALSSVAVDLHVTQIVNQVRGVHALLPFEALR